MRGKTDNSCDVVIIGAGLSGLTSAAILSKAGLKVCVLELNSQPGGYLAKIEKDGFVFDAAIHWLNNCASDGFVTKIFKLIGSDYPVAKTQTRIKRFLGENFDYLLTNNPDELKNIIINDYPDEKKGVEQFFSAAKIMHSHLDKFNRLMRASDTMSFTEKLRYHINRIKFASPFLKYVGFTGKKGKTRGINLFFKSSILHKLFKNEEDLLSCILPMAWAYNKDYQCPPEGGSHTYPQWLTHVVEFFGNKIIYNAKAEKILTDKDSCKSVIYKYKNKRHEIFCKHIIAACDMEQVYANMLPDLKWSSKILKNLKKADIYNSAFIVYASMDCAAEDLGFDEELVSIVINDGDELDSDGSDFKNGEIVVFSQSARDKTLAPPGHGSLTIMIPAQFESNDRWQTEVDEEGNIIRGERYKELKTKYAEALISRVEQKLGADIRKHILKYEAATPITFWRYTKNRCGSMMGIKPGRKNATSGVAHYRTPIKGLYMSGHWSELGGGVPIAVKAALNAVLLVLKERDHNAFEYITGYLDNKKSLEEVLTSEAFLAYDNSWKKSD